MELEILAMQSLAMPWGKYSQELEILAMQIPEQRSRGPEKREKRSPEQQLWLA